MYAYHFENYIIAVSISTWNTNCIRLFAASGTQEDKTVQERADWRSNGVWRCVRPDHRTWTVCMALLLCSSYVWEWKMTQLWIHLSYKKNARVSFHIETDLFLLVWLSLRTCRAFLTFHGWVLGFFCENVKYETGIHISSAAATYKLAQEEKPQGHFSVLNYSQSSILNNSAKPCIMYTDKVLFGLFCFMSNENIFFPIVSNYATMVFW